MKETWEKFPGHEASHQISSLGKVKSLTRLIEFRPGRFGFLKSKILRPVSDKRGYKRIFGKAIHRMIWIAFRGPIPDELEINHKNGVKWDNRLSNLELMTHQDNVKHAYANGLTNQPKGEKRFNSKLTNKIAKEIRARHSQAKTGFTRRGARKRAPEGFRKKLASEYGVHEGTIKRVIEGRIHVD